jgi:hypothetical protein
MQQVLGQDTPDGSYINGPDKNQAAIAP